jgi:putrescine transport system ATP-binding protein
VWFFFFNDTATTEIYTVRIAGGQVMKASVANLTRLVERPIDWEDQVWLSWAADAAIVLTR